MVTTKSKLQMEFNKEVTSASSGLVYVCFGSFVKCSRVLAIATQVIPTYKGPLQDHYKRDHLT
jgi:hypothetical protein